MPRRKQASRLSDQLRELLKAEADDSSVYELARDAGVDRSVLHRFLAGERSITMDTADRLGELLKLRIIGRGR